MTLTTHAVVGAALATAIPGHPVLGFVVGFTSHFLLDSFPHWDYDILSMNREESGADWKKADMIIGKKFAIDLCRIGLDMLVGFGIVFFLLGVAKTPPALWWSSATLWGAIGGVTPDALQFAYFKWKHRPITWLQQFHHLCDGGIDFSNDLLLGIGSQVFIVILAIVLVRLF